MDLDMNPDMSLGKPHAQRTSPNSLRRLARVLCTNGAVASANVGPSLSMGLVGPSLYCVLDFPPAWYEKLTPLVTAAALRPGPIVFMSTHLSTRSVSSRLALMVNVPLLGRLAGLVSTLPGRSRVSGDFKIRNKVAKEIIIYYMVMS